MTIEEWKLFQDGLAAAKDDAAKDKEPKLFIIDIAGYRCSFAVGPDCSVLTMSPDAERFVHDEGLRYMITMPDQSGQKYSSQEFFDMALAIVNTAAVELPVEWLHRALCDIHRTRGQNGLDILLRAYRNRIPVTTT